MAVYLVCEGPLGGLDDRMLDKLVIQPQVPSVLISPTGGSKGHGAVRAHLQTRSSKDVAVSIEDRDYRPSMTASDTWANQTGKSFIWRRHEVENYLLHPRVVVELFNDFRAAGAVWASSLPSTEADVSVLLRTLASSLLEDHVAQMVREEIVQKINAIGSLSFGPRRPGPAAGSPAPGQAEWLPVLQQEAIRLTHTCTTAATLSTLDPSAIASRYTALLSTIQSSTFLSSDGYLIDMGGRELLGILSRHLHTRGAPGSSVNRDVLADGLLQALVSIYQPNTIYQPDDFAELAAVLRQY